MFSYGVTKELNVELDRNNNHNYFVKLISKRTAGNKRTLYKFTVTTPWRKINKSLELKVDSSFYNSIPLGSDLIAVVYPGFINYEWIKELRTLSYEDMYRLRKIKMRSIVKEDKTLSPEAIKFLKSL